MLNFKKFYTYIVSLLLLIGIQCSPTYFYEIEMPLKLEQRKNIKNIGVFCSAYPEYSFKIDKSMPLGYFEPSIRGAVLAAWTSTSKKVEMEKKESEKLTKFLSNWDYSDVFRKNFCNSLSKIPSFNISELTDINSINEVFKNPKYAEKNFQALINLRLGERGVQLTSLGYNIYATVSLVMIQFRTKNIIASHRIIFDLSHAKKIHDDNYAYFIQNEILGGYSTSSSNSIINFDYYKDEYPPDSIFIFPLAIYTIYDRFIENNAEFLKNEFDSLSVDISREFFEYLKFVDKYDEGWRKRYLRNSINLKN